MMRRLGRAECVPMPRTDPDIASRIGARVRAVRHERSYTQEELAHRAGMEPATLSRIENGRLAPSLPALHALGVALEASLADLLDERAAPAPVLSPEELELVECWRALPPEDRRPLRELVLHFSRPRKPEPDR